MSDPLERAKAIVRVAAELDAKGSGVLASEYRRRQTVADPALFALVYLAKHLKDANGHVTLAPAHLEWAESAKSWMLPSEPAGDRRAEIAPREMGKSTWHFLLLPMWAAAHEHVRFAAAFADADAQAEGHLATFKAELDTNALLRRDFAKLCTPKTRGRGTLMADRVSLYHAASDFVFAAAGADSSNLGMKVGDRRPDLLILDDMEPHEARYSAALAAKRLKTLRETIFPLNIRAHVVLVGTVTMQGSIIHQIVRYLRGEIDPPEDPGGNAWVGEERIGGRHTLPIVTDPDGTRRSIWPSKWPLDFLESIEGSRAYAKNYANDPLGADGDYWQIDDFRDPTVAELEGVTHEVISVDPAVTSKDSSDATAIAAVGFNRERKYAVLYEVKAMRLPPDDLRLALIGMISRALARGHVVLVIVETNQGGDLWPKIFHSLPVRIKSYTVSDPKPVRAAEALNYYQAGRRVAHLRGGPLGTAPGPGVRDAEGEMVAYPRAPHDDRVDAVGAGVRYALKRRKAAVAAGATSSSYA